MAFREASAALLAIALAVALALAPPAGAQARDAIVVGVPDDWPPQYSLDASGAPTGFAVDLFDAVSDEAELQVDYRVYDGFSALLRALEAGEIDVIPNVGITDRRADFALFTRPVETFEVVLWCRTGMRDVDGLDDLAGRPVGTVASNVGETLLPDEVQPVTYDDPRAALFDLLSGEVDGVVYPHPVFSSLAVQAGLDGEIRAVDPPLQEIRRAIAVRDELPALRDRLDAALEQVEASGRYAEIYQDWYASPPPWWTVRRIALLGGGALLLVLFGVLGWRVRLQQRLLAETDARDAAEEAHRQTERRLDDLMAVVLDGIFLTDLEGNYVDVNPAGLAMVGYTREELLEMNVRDLVAPSRASRAEQAIAELRNGAKHLQERQLRRSDGTLVPVELSGSRLDEDTIVGIARDISTRQRAQELLLEREHQLQEAQRLEAIGRLAGGIAHDFNNILTVILNNAAWLEASLSAEQAPRIAEILRAARKAASLTRQLLALGSQQVLQPVPTDPAEVVGSVDRMLQRVLPADIELVVSAEAGRAAIVVDPGQLERVVMNLVLNARDAVDAGGRIGIRCPVMELDDEAADRLGTEPGAHAVVEVEDNGEGMDPETLAHVFEPFFTTRHGEGTGLGLATVHGIVRQSGGWIDVRSEVGVGTTFRVGFPCRDDVEQVAAQRETEVAPPSDVPAPVLVVEDEPDVRDLIVQVLRRDGYETLAASNGREALQIARDQELAAVVTDVVMPDLGGPEFLDRLDRPDLPVLFVSGYSDGALQGYLDRPRRAYLPKPFDPGQLRSALAQLLSQ